MTLPDTLPEVFRVVDLSGVLLNGILGGLIARRKNFDVVGFVVLAILTATAGGILRDVMIQAGPPFALTDPYYLYTACVGALVAWFARFESRPARRLLVGADAVVLGTWAATGAYKALNADLGVMPALLLGCVTAVGGSMIRDVAVGETPAVFGGNKLYAIPAFCAALTQVALVRVGWDADLALLAATCVGASLCLLAYWRSWKLPVVSDREQRRVERQVADAVAPARLGVLRRRWPGVVARTVLNPTVLSPGEPDSADAGKDPSGR
ncbi:trimeric intracellular cation channel family protein [Actinomyces trachealis]|uniref:trimeric intracellular cation channel family protein n=1 Tax=Actinomyces trachealis TaxID=2763540 RepID=UPI001892CCA4|nr:trimeric intracellular cation channel family protein [Actinomyces trachealis]